MATTQKATAPDNTKPVDLPHMPPKPDAPPAHESKPDLSLLPDQIREEMEAGARGLTEAGDKTKQEMELGAKNVAKAAAALKKATPESEVKHDAKKE